MRLKYCFVHLLFLLLVLGFSCERLPNDPNSTSDSEIILEIKELPKEAFLKFIEESANLDDGEKNFIKKIISPRVYTHVKFVKYKQNGETFLEVDQFYPRKVIGQDSEGHQLVTGGSGSVGIYRLENNSWVPVKITNYD